MHTCGALKVRNKVNIISKLGNKKAHVKFKHLQDLYITVLSQPARTRVLAAENLSHALIFPALELFSSVHVHTLP